VCFIDCLLFDVINLDFSLEIGIDEMGVNMTLCCEYEIEEDETI